MPIPDHFIARYLDTLNRIEDPTSPPDDLMNMIREIQEDDEAHDTMNEITRRLPEATSPIGAAWHSVILGASIERGRDPAKTVKPIVETLLKWNRTLPDEPEDDDTLIEIDAPTSQAIDMLGQATVTHLSRLPDFETHIDVPSVRRELGRTEAMANGAMWVMQIFRQESGSVLVLHATQAFGAMVAFENVANNFHLFTLLQSALAEVAAPGAKRTKARVVQAAREGCSATDAVRDDAWWHYGQAAALEPAPESMVFGEGTPEEIDTVDGQKVILLWPPIMASRGWGGGFFGPILEARPPDVRIERVLEDKEVLAWRSKLGLPEPAAPTADKPKWKFW